MTAPVLPSEEEVAELVPRPGSTVWRYAGDARLLSGAGYALILQVSHPTVGAGVGEHSNYAEDPWGRLLRTLDYTYVMVYGGPALAAATGRRVRDLHKRIRGERPDGTRYHALEPEAYAWVHATLAQSIVDGHRAFGRPMRPDTVQRFYDGWRRLGRMVGVRDRDLPETWAGFRDYFDAMVAERLEDNAVVHGVLRTLTKPAAPPVPGLGEGAWRVARVPMARLGALATVGLLPAALRRRFGLDWTRTQELEFRALCRASRAATPLLPAALRNTGPNYVRWRHEALERGEVAGAETHARLDVTMASPTA
ncbi:MAG: hypothetical protein QOE65_1813 [Solirubrobacteraceae bacterium]|jgi:uncharacterized protein (DUF2236 family)|nr:hypothetical protein [Solirubrobacteraceae bacterium]